MAGYFKNIDRYGNEILNGGGAPDFKPTPITYTPTASGNTSDLNSFVIDPNGDIYFIDEQGDSFKVNTTETLTSIVDNGDGTFTYTDENGNETVIDPASCCVSGYSESVTSIVQNPDGTYTYKNEEGIEVIINQLLNVLTGVQPTPTATGNTTNLNSVFKDANGDTWVVDVNGNAILAGSAAVAETVTTITDVLATGNTIGTYKNEAGTDVVLKETITSVSELSILENVITLKYVDEAGTTNEKTVTVPDDVVTTLTDALATGNKIGTYTNESGVVVDINETITSIGTVLFDIATGLLTIPYTDEAGVVNDKTVTLPIPLNVLTNVQPTPTATGNTTNLNSTFKDAAGNTWIVDSIGDAIQAGNAPFKNLNEYHVDPNGNDTTGDGSQEKPFLTITKALTLATPNDQVIVHAGSYTEDIVISNPNIALVGAQSEYGSLTQINGSVTVTASGASVKISDIGIGSIVHTGTSPLYLVNATVLTTLNSSSTGYVEIKNTSIQDGDITKSAGNILIENSKISNVGITGSGTAAVIRDSYQEGASTVTFGAGTIYGIYNLQGGEVVVDAAAIPIESAALAQGLTAEMAKEAETSDFMKLGMLRPDAEASPTKYVTWDEVTGRLEVSPAPTTGGASAIWVSESTDPTFTGNTGTLPRFQWNTTNDSKWYVDSNGIALLIEGVSEGCGNVFFDAENPVDAATFDTENPPITNDPALRNLDCATYISAIDGSVWTSDGTTYKTKTYSAPTHRFTETSATSGQTSFTLPSIPIGSSTLASQTGIVKVSRNGVDISRAWSWIGAVGTYTAASNYGSVIDAGDNLQFHWEAL
jgi:hypothetical protein